VPATNLFLPAPLKVTGPAIDPEQQMAYVKKAFARLARIGTEIVVFGSGGARQVPDGFPKDQAFQQLVDFGKRIAPEARARGITVAVEPLRRQETNIINSAAEGLTLVNAIGDPNFQLMVDFYHLASEQEDPAIIPRAATQIRHLHMANPTGRVFPRRWDEFDYAPFFAALQKIGYDKRISVEASTQDFSTDAPLAIALLRRAFQ
jgi:sugar phosphate isomerase/epimerase